jgi:hypothetical protein
MRPTNKQLLADNKFKIGFEFEFVAYGLCDVLSDQTRKMRIPEIFLHELDTCFHVSKSDYSDIENLLAYAGYSTNKYGYFSAPNDLIEYGTDRMIALLGLMPTKNVYRKVGSGYKDVTEEIKDKITSADRTDPRDLVRLGNSLRRCYVDTPVLGEYSSFIKETEDQIYNMMVHEFNKHSGITMKRVESYSIATKKKPGWYLTEEYVDDIKEDHIEYGFEIITPALHPVEALEALRAVLSFLSSDNIPFKVRTGKDCGVHINISHEDKVEGDVHQLYYSLMFDDVSVIKLFGRTRQHMCAAMKPFTIKEIKRLTKENAITLDGLNDPNTIQRVLDIIEASTESGGLKSARFDNMHKWGYVEYRMAGGKKYHNRYKEIAAHTIDLLRFTMDYEADNTKNKAFIGKIRSTMKEAGAQTGTGRSILEDVPAFLTRFPKPKRANRIDSNELLKIRDA